MTAATDHRSGGVRFTFEEDLVTAIDVDSGVAACGPTKADALDELADALRLHDRDDSRFDTEAAEASVLRDLGIDPDAVEPVVDLPDFLK